MAQYYRSQNILPFDIIGFKSRSLFGKTITASEKNNMKKNGVKHDNIITHVGYIVTWDILNCTSVCDSENCRGSCRNMQDDRLYIMEAILDIYSKEIPDVVNGNTNGVLLRPLADVLYSYEKDDPKMEIVVLKWISPYSEFLSGCLNYQGKSFSTKEQFINWIRYRYTCFHDKHHSKNYDNRITSLLGTNSTLIKSVDKMIDFISPNDADFCSDLVTSMIVRFGALPADVDTKLVTPQHIYQNYGGIIPCNFFKTLGNITIMNICDTRSIYNVKDTHSFNNKVLIPNKIELNTINEECESDSIDIDYTLFDIEEETCNYEVESFISNTTVDTDEENNSSKDEIYTINSNKKKKGLKKLLSKFNKSTSI